MTERTYDGLNRVRSESVPRVYSLAFAYDAGSRRIRVQDSLGGVTSLVYDAANRLRSRQFDVAGDENDRNIVVKYKTSGGLPIDLVHSITSHQGLVGTPDNQVYSRQSDYDDLGRVSKIEYARPKRGNAVGMVTEKLVYGYNANGLQDRLERATHGLEDASPGDAFSYRLTTLYDAVGQVRKEQRQLPREKSFVADPDLPQEGSEWDWPTPEKWEVSYDATGNLKGPLSIVEHGERLLRDSEWEYRYDREGRVSWKIRRHVDVDRVNPQRINAWSYNYDAAGRLTSVKGWKENPINPSMEETFRVGYEYDAEGRLVKRSETVLQSFEEVSEAERGTTVTRYAHDGTRVWADLDGLSGNSLQTRYLRGDGVDEILGRQGVAKPGEGVSTLWYGTDAQGSVLHVITETGLFLKRVRYRAGQADHREAKGGLEDRYEYTGREYDRRTKMQYHNARWYDPVSGRWTSEDPLRELGGDYNLYRYAGNSAPNATDRNGMFWGWAAVGIGAGVGATLGVAGQLISSAIMREEVSFAKLAGAAAGGAVAGALMGAVGGALTGDVSALIVAGVVTGAAGGWAGGFTEQMIEKKGNVWQVDYGQVYTQAVFGAAAGAVGGAFAGGVSKGVARGFGMSMRSLAKESMSCTLTARQVAMFTAAEVAGGGVSGLASDGVSQGLGLLTGQQTEWNWRQTLGAGVAGLATGGAGYRMNRALQKVCFCGEMPLRTPGGSKRIDAFVAGDAIFGRDDDRR